MKIVAIIAAFNEADIIATVVDDLIQQGISVYFLDDGSTDRTIAAVEPFVGRGVAAIERMDASNGHFDWERILHRKAQLARELDADWFIHHDADEFRESPWPHLTLAEAIRRVDAAGYNAIDFASFNFWPVHDDFELGADVRAAYPYYSEHAPFDRVQIRCWKKADDVDLAASGGHEARFAGRKVFPLRFVLRHYPIRGEAHGRRKIFDERRKRFRAEERARGWHVQYDEVVDGAPLVRTPETLQEYDRDGVRLALALRHRGVEELEAAVDDRQTALGEARATIIRQHHELTAALQELESRTLDLEAHRREIVARRQEMDRAAAALAASRIEAAAHLEARRVQVAELEAELERRTAVVRVRDIEIRNWKRSLDDAIRRTHAVEDSWSWRLTAPMRALARLLRGR
ncbi:MAG TPA: glycosyltransferase family 2 protein [Vicinamibacterales bacterium]|nr:glycosyltransferase family 2 protein [Vicinamibacterales bacterium]